ncbi:DUF6063 family protein [Sporomusa malonica]|uniref:Non-ribosomal peptide synthetase module n=1 Tax=Sporomusa malonica TaxID=112901 RepID=A0A1W1YBE5_9FIRM|nr:DUF6063 family protein [Sporomusa malonica]SMC33473.1 hypothetical protein SAMN04488500_101216 [Sporomusa malonica]
MRYEQNDVIKAFQLFSLLTQQGFIEKDDVEFYRINEEVQSLVEQFAREVDAVLVLAADIVYLIPATALSPFHVKNEQLRREMGSNATNADIYMMYFCILVFIGEFYNSYLSNEVQRDFLTTSQWLDVLQERLNTLRQHSADDLSRHAEELQYNWLAILEKWDALNDLKESAQSQKGNTVSRLSFLHKVLQFMFKEKLVEQVGPDEYILTEKTKTIVQRYFMELDYNRGILQFMYRYDERKDETYADNL